MTNITKAITRRSVLGGIAAALPTIGIAAPDLSPGECPYERVRRLTSELSHALNDYSDGRWFATIYPSKKYDYAVMLGAIAQHHCPHARLSVAIGQAKKAMFEITGTAPKDFSNIDSAVVALAVLPAHKTKLKWFFDDDLPLFARDEVQS